MFLPIYFLAIMLARFKIPPFEIAKAIIQLDDDILSLENINNLANQAPTADEVPNTLFNGIELVCSYEGADQLGKVESFIKHVRFLFNSLAGIPRLTSRLRTLSFCASFPDKILDLKNDISTLNESLSALIECKGLVVVMQVKKGTIF